MGGLTALAAWLALALAVWALSRAGRADERAERAERELRRLAARQDQLEAQITRRRWQEEGSPSTPGLPEAPATFPEAMPGEPAPTAAPPLWPEDVVPPAPPPRPKPRGPSLWDAAYSRARISVIGGVLVLGGLAFTLRELGAPGWTRLLAVFAFGALLYFNARRVPWPVSGALRGLGYGVTALGVGSLAQALPVGWGPGVTMLGLLALSAALLWDGLRRREPLLGALAVLGAGLSAWMLTDDLGRWSVVAAGAVLLLTGVAVSGPSAQEVPEETDREATRAPRAALALTLGAAGLVPLGWAVAAAGHVDANLLLGRGEEFARRALMLGGNPAPGLLAWLAFAGLALAPALALLRRRETEVPAPVPALAAWATVGPGLLVAAAVGTALSGPGATAPAVLGLSGAILAVPALAAWRVWRRLAAGPEAAGASLTGTLAGALTAAATGVAGAAVLGLLGARTEPVALSGVALALLLVGLSARSRGWLAAGAWGLGLSAVWGTSLAGAWSGTAGRAALVNTGLAMLPAAVGLLGALRLGRDAWASGPRLRPASPPSAGEAASPPGPRPRLTAPLLAGSCSALAVWALVLDDPAPLPLWLALATALLAAGLWAVGLRGSAAPGRAESPARRTAYWCLAPGAALGALALPPVAVDVVNPGREAALACAAALAAVGALLGTAQRGEEGPRGVVEGTALLALVLALCAVTLTWLPGLGVPGAVALAAGITAPLRLVWDRGRLDVLMGLGLAAALVSLLGGVWGALPVPAAGVLLLGLVWFLTRTAGGLGAVGGHLPGSAAPQRPPVQAVWLSALLGLGLLSLGARMDPSVGGLRPWLALSSLVVLGVGTLACVAGHRSAGAGQREARPLWDTGLGLILAAGLKGALLDAPAMDNRGAALGVAVLATGLSLLAVAVLAPRPAGSARAAPAGES